MQTIAVHVRYGPLLDFARTLVRVRAMREREGKAPSMIHPSIWYRPTRKPGPSVNTATNAVSEEEELW